MINKPLYSYLCLLQSYLINKYLFQVERKYLGEHLDEYNSQVEYEEWKDSMARNGDEMTLHNKSKARHPMSRRTLRQRKIQSVKRQIQIKEKMLEVNNFIS